MAAYGSYGRRTTLHRHATRIMNHTLQECRMRIYEDLYEDACLKNCLSRVPLQLRSFCPLEMLPLSVRNTCLVMARAEANLSAAPRCMRRRARDLHPASHVWVWHSPSTVSLQILHAMQQPRDLKLDGQALKPGRTCVQ